MRVVGVDPGAHGAIALVADGQLVSVHAMPMNMIRRGKSDKAEVDGYALANLIRELRPDIGYVEKVGGITGQAASAAFNFGRAAGAPEYILKALGVRVELVPPGTWKKALQLNTGKDGARATASKLWPAHSSSFALKKDIDKAEAALIAEYGSQQNRQKGETNVFA